MGRIGRISWLLAALLLLTGWTEAPSAAAVVKPTPAPIPSSPKPYPRIEAGGHTAKITNIAVDWDGRWLVTASHDKSARVWSVTDGRLERVLRPPVGEGNEGKLYAVALSPDGSMVAVGGWTGYEHERKHSIYLFDRASGILIRRLEGFSDVVQHLTFSRDGRHLAATLGGTNGLRVWRTADWQLTFEDRDYGGDSYWADFAPDGRLITTSYDGKLRLYGPDFKKSAEHEAPGGVRLFGVAFSPDGRTIAMGYADTTTVELLAADDLRPLAEADTSSIDNGDLSTVAWSRDGRQLYAGGLYDRDGLSPIVSWNQGGRGTPREWPAGGDTLMDLQPLPGGALAYGSTDPALGVIEASGEPRWQHAPSQPDLRGAYRGRFHLSPDATTIEFGLDIFGTTPLRFTLGEGVTDAPGRSAYDSTKPRIKAPGMVIRGWNNTTAPTLNDTPLELRRYERSRALAITPDQRHFLLGTSWSLRYYDQRGELLWKNAVPGTAWAVNIASNGKMAVAGFGDGTLRWYRLSDGKELLALFVHREDRRWVAWTPEGFYDASPGGESLFGYHLNQGPDREGIFVEVAQLKEPFYRPDLIAGRLNDNDAEIQQALAEIGDVRQILAGGLPPALAWQDEIKQEIVESPHQTLKVTADDRGGGIGRVEFRVNGVLMNRAKGRFHEVQGPEGQRIYTQPVTLGDGENLIEVTIYNRNGGVASKPLARRVTLNDPMALPATLHVLAVGSDRYRGLMPDNVLDFAASDAVRVADTLERGGKRLFADTNVVRILNPQATLAGITDALKAMAKQVKPNDVFVLYLAGHAEGDGKNYYYMPWDFAWSGDEALKSDTLHSGLLSDLLSKIGSSKRLLILDTCNAGDMILAGLDTKYRSDRDSAAIARLRGKVGRAILAATRSGKLAMEGIDGSGAFTGVLIRGLKGAAERETDGFIGVSELADYLEREVPRITLKRLRHEQIPMRQITGDSFPLSRIQP